MPIQFKCPKCAKVLKVADAHAGKTAKCPGCSTGLRIPKPKPKPKPAGGAGKPAAAAKKPAAAGAKPAPSAAEPEPKAEMVACFFCDKEVPKSEAVQRGDDLYCEECNEELGPIVQKEEDEDDFLKPPPGLELPADVAAAIGGEEGDEKPEPAPAPPRTPARPAAAPKGGEDDEDDEVDSKMEAMLAQLGSGPNPLANSGSKFSKKTIILIAVAGLALIGVAVALFKLMSG